MANINESGYFLSNAVRVYPCAYRGNNIDPAAKYTTEHNITNAPVGLKHKNSYIVDIVKDKAGNNTGLKVVIGGYYFELALGSDDDLANKKLVIKPRTIDGQEYLGAVLTNITAVDESLTLDGSLTLDDTDAESGNSYFYGLGVQAIEADDTLALAPTSTSLVVFTEDGEINQFAVLPEVTHGKAEGETVLRSATIGATSIGGTLAVAEDTALSKDLIVGGTLMVNKDTTLQGGLAVSNISNLNGGIAVDTNRFKVEDSTGNTTVAGTLTVDGISNLKGGIAVNIDGTNKFTVDTDGDADVAGTLTVNGDTELKGSLTVGSGVDDTATLRGALTVDGTLTVHGTSVSAESAAVTVESLETKNGNITCNGNLVVTGQTTLADNIFIGTAALRNYLVDLIYPIGSIYMTMGTDNPEDLFGGDWDRIAEGRVLLGADNSEYIAGHDEKGSGGSETVTLNANQVPLRGHKHYVNEHDHNVVVGMTLTCRGLGATGAGVVSGLTLGDNLNKNSPATWTEVAGEYDAVSRSTVNKPLQRAKVSHTFKTKGATSMTSSASEGDAQPVSILPPYLVCNIWQRTE